ncbi:glycoside hydrolase family 13 protein [Prauserella cavernicola]|uniref:Glycoside hydrolase family 13 protein n=1 Tax=Prauserella cavernicola TaxID=2800127 RepID=A0A934V3P9_9PSEU|nr:glycoside hydrolase family 13 protein [Prauserella cavernicola]MBK1787511.1 glycoside hydrolase family 13 protein [Prauserella cavernicola]
MGDDVTSTPWWRDAVIYQLYIQSFADGDADGIGDIAGLRDRIPYLSALGIDAIWITPWFRSPLHDAGYDVADYRDIHPRYGSVAEARDLIGDCHAAGIRVVLDIVPNHTSSEHAWFVEALSSPPGSAARARYHFQPGRDDGQSPPNDWLSVFGGPAWTRVEDGEWYLHLFDSTQPDLNWDNEVVRSEFEDILRFWFDLGVDGFRIDVATALVKAPGLPDLGYPDGAFLADLTRPNHPHRDRDEVHDIYRSWRKLADSYDPPRTFAAEAWLDDAERLSRYVRPDELHTALNLYYLKSAWTAQSMRRAIDASVAATSSVGAPTTWGLSNHDVERVATRYGRADTRRRPGVSGTELGPVDERLGRRRARAAALLTLALPGSVYLYQGDELGLTDADVPEHARQDPIWIRSEGRRPGRDGARVPLPWTEDGSSFGFGDNGSWLPQPAGWGARAVSVQDGDDSSFLELYRTALALRRSHPALGGTGELHWGDAPGDDVLVFTREPGFACVVNFGSSPAPLPLRGSVLLSSDPGAVEGELPADGAVWLELGR